MRQEIVLVIDDSPTTRKVVQLVLSKAGYDVVTAEDGQRGLEAAREHDPSLILLDFVMPKLNGYQVCRELADDSNLKDIPVVLMSAKGDQVGERFVKVMGIVDYITKPFSPEAITAVVQHSIAKYGERAVGEYTRPIIAGTESLEDIESDTNEQTTDSFEYDSRELLGEIRDEIATILSSKLAAPEPDTKAEGSESHADEEGNKLAQTIAHALDDESLMSLLRRGQPAITAADGEPSLKGDVRVIPIAEVLQLLDAQNQSGVLTVERDGAVLDVFFRGGRIDFAAAHEVSEEFLLGRFLVDGGLMNQEDLDGFLESRTSDTRLMGEQLVKLGYLSTEELSTVLQAQTRELVYELLRWGYGSFHFSGAVRLPPRATEASLALDVEGILMEGFRRVDEWHLIEREIENFDLVFLRNEDAVAHMGRGQLTRDELAILELVNGKNTVKDLIRASRLGSFEVSKMLYRLFSIKLIRRRVLPVAV